jgi:hypothetical protein
MPDGPSRWAYAGNSPLMNVDPSGRLQLPGAVWFWWFFFEPRPAPRICTPTPDSRFPSGPLLLPNEQSDGEGDGGGVPGEAQPGDKDPSTPTGQGKVQPGTNKPATIGGRNYTDHAIDSMQGRGIPPSVVEEAIQEGTPSPDPIPGRIRFYDPKNNVTVVTESDGTVVTVIPGKR